MKSYFFIIIFLLCLSLNTFKAYNAEECQNNIYLNNVNSKNLIDYLIQNNLREKVNKVCSVDICMTINPNNLERDIKSFITRNINFLKNRVDENTFINLQLKGFKIEKITINEC